MVVVHHGGVLLAGRIDRFPNGVPACRRYGMKRVLHAWVVRGVSSHEQVEWQDVVHRTGLVRLAVAGQSYVAEMLDACDAVTTWNDGGHGVSIVPFDLDLPTMIWQPIRDHCQDVQDQGRTLLALDHLVLGRNPLAVFLPMLAEHVDGCSVRPVVS